MWFVPIPPVRVFKPQLIYNEMFVPSMHPYRMFALYVTALDALKT
jgi:hypothetical protein